MKIRLSALARLTLAVGVAALVVVGVACGEDSDGDSNESSGSAAASSATVGPDGAITIIAKDNVYEPKAFTGPTGQTITVTLENQGAAIHNFVIKDQRGDDGKEIQTELINAGKSGSVQFALPADEFEFYCSVHPVEMRGKMTLQ